MLNKFKMESKDIEIDNVKCVCRLCLGTDSLIWVFDDRIEIPENIIDVIQITTGVTISPTDCVSQMLCSTCLHITIKMFKFRSSSIVNDLELKAKATVKLKSCMDKSVESILSKYPKVILPSSITKCNVAPSVTVNRNEVKMWLEYYRKKRKVERKKRKELKMATAERLKNDHVQDNNLLNSELTRQLNENETCEKAQNSADVFHLPERSALKVLEHNITPRLVQTALHQGTEQPSPLLPDSSQVLEQPLEEENQSKRKSVSSSCPEPKKFKSYSENSELDSPSKSLVTLKYVNKSLFLCNICNGILYSAKSLKKHKMKHMKCILCKQIFSTMEETENHRQKDCPIKNIMDNLPTIFLKRCDQVKELRNQYPMAFNCSPEKDIEDNIGVEFVKEDSSEKSFKSKEMKMIPASLESDSVNKISLISDTEEDSINTTETAATPTSSKDNLKNVQTIEPPESAAKTTSTLSRTRKKLLTNGKKVVVVSPSNITVTPDIEIVGENILDVNFNDNDISLLKNILMRTRKKYTEVGVQTNIPCNDDVVASRNKDMLFNLKNLREHLNYYKIPVNISYASQYSVRYGYEPSPLLKRDRSWSKINPKMLSAPIMPPLRKILVDLGNQKNQSAKQIVTTESKRLASPEITAPMLVIQNTPNISGCISAQNTETTSIGSVPLPITKHSDSLPQTAPIRTEVNDKVGALSTNHIFLNQNCYSQPRDPYSQQAYTNFVNCPSNSTALLLSKNDSYQLSQPNLYLIHKNNNNTIKNNMVANGKIPTPPSTNQADLIANIPSSSNSYVSNSLANIMTPPLTSFVTQRSMSTISKQNSNKKVPPPQMERDAATTSTSTWNDGIIFKPVIRVKSVSELK